METVNETDPVKVPVLPRVSALLTPGARAFDDRILLPVTDRRRTYPNA